MHYHFHHILFVGSESLGQPHIQGEGNSILLFGGEHYRIWGHILGPPQLFCITLYLITCFSVYPLPVYGHAPYQGSDTGLGTEGSAERIFNYFLGVGEFNHPDYGAVGPSLASEKGLKKLRHSGPGHPTSPP